jgi:uncharacterized damage-inducible protein DinB
MTIAASLLPEFDREMAATRVALSRIPDGRLPWRPHEKSMTVGRLGTHLAEVPDWIVNALTADELDVAPPGGAPFEPRVAPSTAAILDAFDGASDRARRALMTAADADFAKPWTLKTGGQTVFTVTRMDIYRRWGLNHMIHHRGQLTVYLRLLGAAVPATLGPSADELGEGRT